MKFIISLLQAINLAYEHAVTRVAGFIHNKVTEKASVADIERAVHFLVPLTMLLMVYIAPAFIVKVVYTASFGMFFAGVLLTVLENGEKFFRGSPFKAKFQA